MHIKNTDDLSMTNSKLIELIASVKSASKEEFMPIMNDIAQEIAMNARFVSPVRFSKEPILNENGTAQLPEGTTISFAQLENDKGQKFYPVFTSADELMKWEQMKAQQPQTLTLGFDDYASMILDRNGGEGFVINPFSDNLMIAHEAVERWRKKKQLQTKGHIEQRLSPDTKLDITEPKELPMPLVNAVTEAAKKDAAVKALWLLHMEHDNSKSHLLVVDFDGERDKVYTALGSAAKPFIGGMDLSIISAADSLGRDVTKDRAPIYKA